MKKVPCEKHGKFITRKRVLKRGVQYSAGYPKTKYRKTYPYTFQLLEILIRNKCISSAENAHEPKFPETKLDNNYT